MKALTLTAVGGPEHLRVRELPEPTIQSPDQVLVRIHAAALNRLDLFVADGLPGANYSFPHVMGSDGAGIVVELGPAVAGLRRECQKRLCRRYEFCDSRQNRAADSGRRGQRSL